MYDLKIYGMCSLSDFQALFLVLSLGLSTTMELMEVVVIPGRLQRCKEGQNRLAHISLIAAHSMAMWLWNNPFQAY